MIAWFMDEIVRRLLMSTPHRKAMRAHMDDVRAQDMRLYGEVHPRHRKGWLRP